jgi:hypothetical protein
MKVLRIIIFCLVTLYLVSCNSFIPSPTQGEIKTETPPQVEPTVEPTVTMTPEPTATEVIQPDSEIVVEGLTGVKPDFLLGGNLEIKEEMGKKFYTEFLDALAKNNENQEYMVGLLGQNPDGAKLMDYLRNNNYVLPAGLNLPYRYQAGYVRLGRNPIKEEIKLDTVKGVAFGATEWNSNAAGIVDYVNSLKTYGSLISTSDIAYHYLGWAIDVRDGRLVFVAGSKALYNSNILDIWENYIIGGGDGGFNFDRDAKVVLGEWLQIAKLLETYVYDGKHGNIWTVAFPFGEACGEQETSGVCDDDIAEFLGSSEESMFRPGKQ